MFQSKAGYIDARPPTANSSKTSCNARPDHTFGSFADVSSLWRLGRLYPSNRTSVNRLAMSALGQFQTRASSQFSVEANACPFRQCTVGWLLMGMGFPR